MPYFDNVEVEYTGITRIDVEFEVYCDTCNNGLCNNTETQRSRTRNQLGIRVEACPNCMKNKDDEIKELEYKIRQLEDEIYELKRT